MEERLAIIDSFKPFFGKRKKGIQNRVFYLKLALPIYAIMVLFAVSVVIGSGIIGFESMSIFQWDKMGLIVLLSLSFGLNLPNIVYELQLLNHAKRMQGFGASEGAVNINSELKQILGRVNRPKNRWFLLPLVAIIAASSLWQILGDENPFWQYFQWPALIFYGIVLYYFIHLFRAIAANIEKAELEIRAK